MHSRVEIVAEAESGGGTRFSTLAADGGIAVRRTSPAGVHLVGTAAGPIGDDTIEISVVVGRGARLQVSGVAATICLPGAVPETSRIHFTVMLHSEATLVCSLPTLIVCRGASVGSTTEVVAEASSQLVLDESVSLGRSGEAGGGWSSRMLVDIDGRPALRQTQSAASILAAVSREVGATVLSGAAVSRLELGTQVVAPSLPTRRGALSLDLPLPGRLTTSVGSDLRQATQDRDALFVASLTPAEPGPRPA